MWDVYDEIGIKVVVWVECRDVLLMWGCGFVVFRGLIKMV